MPKNRPKERHIAATLALSLSAGPEVRRCLIDGIKQAIQTDLSTS